MNHASYVFKPRRQQVDEVRLVVDALRDQGLQSLTISKFYDCAADGLLLRYRSEPEIAEDELERYLRQRSAEGQPL